MKLDDITWGRKNRSITAVGKGRGSKGQKGGKTKQNKIKDFKKTRTMSASRM